MSAAPPAGQPGSGGSTPVRVVIVDDSAVQRRFARAALEADGNVTVVGEARNGRDAVAMVDRLRPEAVLMDLHLPVMNGIEAIERIMATRPTRRCRRDAVHPQAGSQRRSPGGRHRAQGGPVACHA